MAFTNTAFDDYQVLHYNAEFIDRYGLVCRIMCLSGTRVRGLLYFYREGATIPPSSQASSGVINLRFPAYQVSQIMETLRRDKPLYLRYDDTRHEGALMTTEEPVGEEEVP